MEEFEVVPVFHHGRYLKRNSQGKLDYVDGNVKKWPPLDIDLVNFFYFEALLKELAYSDYKTMFWFDSMAPELESGLHVMKGDAEINEMRDNKSRNKKTNEIHIYFDHPVNVPEVAEEEKPAENIFLSDSSSSSDGYETTEDEPYKPPPPGYESSNSSEDSEEHRRRERLKKKKKKNIVSPRKRASKSPKGEVKSRANEGNKVGPTIVDKVDPSKKNDKAGPSKSGPTYSPRTAKKKAKKKYSGRRRIHVLRVENSGLVAEGNDGSRNGLGNNKVGAISKNVRAEEDSNYEKSYEYESETFNSPVLDDDEGRTVFDAFNEETEYGEVEFKVGQTFITMEAFKNALKDYFVYEGKDVVYVKNEKKRVRAACASEQCLWLILTSWNNAAGCYQVKTLVNEHNCARDYGSNLADRHWVTSKLVKRLNTQPDLKPKQAMEYMIEDYNVHLSGKMISRSLKAARETVIGSEQAQYEKLRDYLMELHRSNPGSTALMDVIPQPESLPLFDKLYISLDACKKGFREGCRPLIGLDGCFFKGYYGGQLLSAVGQDANNHFFVIAYAVVPNECRDTWKWFLTLLQQDLGDCNVLGLNFVSDQQKGLELAMKEVFPNAYHRNCVLHIWKNFIKRFKDEQTKQLVWECARCTTFTEFASAMEKMKQICTPAWEYMQKFEPRVWCKAYFSHGPKVDNITNNMCEVWNAKIVPYRGKPILTMYEELRCYIMRKMAMHKKKLEAHIGPLAPVQQKKLDQFIKPKSHKWRAQWTGDPQRILYEVRLGSHKLGVNLQDRTCACNVWQLTGMPCRHAVAALASIGLKAEDFVHKWLTMDSVRSTYSHCIKPVNIEEYWTPTDSPRPLPPTIKRAAHRPKLKRRADPIEREMSTTKAKKTFIVTCSKCGQNGHYYKTCTNAPRDPNWKPMTKKERRAQGKILKQNSSTNATNTTNQTQEDGNSTNINDNAINGGGTVLDASCKARKTKKKLPKIATRVTTMNQGQGEEIPLSQSAPQVEEPAPDNFNGSLAPFRKKQQIVRPTAPGPPLPPVPAPGQTLWFESQPSQSPCIDGSISAETMAAASSTTASRL